MIKSIYVLTCEDAMMPVGAAQTIQGAVNEAVRLHSLSYIRCQYKRGQLCRHLKKHNYAVIGDDTGIEIRIDKVSVV